MLASWVDELEPGRRRRRAKAGSFADEQKREAVIALASRKAPAQEVADAVGVTRAVLCKWKNQLLGEEAPCKMEAAPKDMADDVDALKSQAAELQEQIKRLELRKAILEGAVELLGKGRGVDPGMLTNREKALIANSLRCVWQRFSRHFGCPVPTIWQKNRRCLRFLPSRASRPCPSSCSCR